MEGWQRESYKQAVQQNNDSVHDSLLSVVVPFHINFKNQDSKFNPNPSIQHNRSVPFIYVDDHSESVNSQLLTLNSQLISSSYPRGKKYALRAGMEYASTPYVITTDIDTNPTDEWLNAIAEYYSQHSTLNLPDLLILPLKMRQPRNFFEAMQETEYVALQTLTGGYAMAGEPIMCSGANMVVNRLKWLDSWENIRPEVPSGDDMFVLHSFKRQGLSIGYLKSQAATLIIEPASCLKSLFRQRARWAGKAGHYTDRMTKLVGAVVVAANISVLLFPPFVFVKWIIDLNLLWTSRTFFNFRRPVLKSLLLSVIYPFYVLATLILIPFRGKDW